VSWQDKETPLLLTTTVQLGAALRRPLSPPPIADVRKVDSRIEHPPHTIRLPKQLLHSTMQMNAPASPLVYPGFYMTLVGSLAGSARLALSALLATFLVLHFAKRCFGGGNETEDPLFRRRRK
jgi:hypothetical protein